MRRLVFGRHSLLGRGRGADPQRRGKKAARDVHRAHERKARFCYSLVGGSRGSHFASPVRFRGNMKKCQAALLMI
jgi:hypothetical protein